jgi:hypothetical protein
MIEDGFSIYARTIVTGHSGAGIVFCAPGGTPLPVAPLYTKLASCKHEYRVHVWGDNVIDVAQKKKRSRPEEGEEGYETWQEPSTIIRNHDNGYVFCHGGVSLSTEIKDLCIEATKIMKLDFTAIDIIVDRNGRPTILEFNSVPGMSVTDDGEPSITMTKYIESIKSVIN